MGRDSGSDGGSVAADETAGSANVDDGPASGPGADDGGAGDELTGVTEMVAADAHT